MKKIIALLFSALFLTLSACGENPQQPEQTGEATVSIEEYVSVASALNENIYGASVVLSNCAQYINNYWKALEGVSGTFNADKALEKTDEWLQENSDYSMESVKASYTDIADRYKGLLRMEISDPVTERATEKITELYDAYSTLYTEIMSVGGSRSDFIDTYNDCSGVISATYESITTLLK